MSDIHSHISHVKDFFTDIASYKNFLIGSNLPTNTPFDQKKNDFYNHLINLSVGNHPEIKKSVHEALITTEPFSGSGLTLKQDSDDPSLDELYKKDDKWQNR